MIRRLKRLTGGGKESFLMSVFLMVTFFTLLVNVLNIFPGYGKVAFTDKIIDYVLNVDNSLLEILDVFIVLGCLMSAVKELLQNARYKPFFIFVILLMLFFLGEELSYGKHLGFELTWFHHIDGADEGNFHNANFFPGLDLEVTNLFYIIGAPFFLFLFDQRMGFHRLRKLLRLPSAELTNLQLGLFLLGCLILPLDGLPNDIELDQVFVNSIYFYIWIMVIRLQTNKDAMPQIVEEKREGLFLAAKIATFLAFLRMVLYYINMD